jgi:hypothetical protein
MVTDNVYELDVSQDDMIKHIHPRINVKNLRLWNTSDRFRKGQLAPEPVIIDSHTELVIDQIINDRWNKLRKRYEYQTVWQGLPISKASWVPVTGFTGSAIKFVHRYLENLPTPHSQTPDEQRDEVDLAVQPYL